MNTQTESGKLNPLKNLATQVGVQTGYQSAFGTYMDSSPQALVPVLNAVAGLGLKEDLSNVETVAKKFDERRWKSLSEPVAVFWEGRPAEFVVRYAESKGKKVGKVSIEVKTEQGKKWKTAVDISSLPETAAKEMKSARLVEKKVPVSKKLPFGYHTAQLKLGKEKQTVMIISAPFKAYAPKKGPKRSFGVFAPLYALHSKDSLGIGDFGDLRKMVDWAYGMGCDFVGTLPMLSIFNDKPVVEPSPYSPLSRLFWNEMYVQVQAAAEWKKCKEAKAVFGSEEFQSELARLNAAREVDYQAVAQLKRRVLEPMAELFFKEKKQKSPAFKQFLAVYPNAEDYAEFRAVGEAKGKVWREWPARLQKGVIKAGDYREADKRYHLYMQFLAHEQLSKLAKDSKKRGTGVYIDFPLSAHADGYDVWRERDSFAQKVSAGCPPDPAHVHGQNWGILPLNPQSIRENGYRYFRQCLESHMRYAGLLRLDHVMAFFRLYWVPHGLTAKDGAYARYNLDEYFALLVLESHRSQCVLIGEDLGTVPQEIRDAMTEHGILRMYVQQRRLAPNLDEPLAPVPQDCICSLNTHDMPPFAAFWNGLDILDKMDLGYFPKTDLPAKQKVREDQKAALLHLLIQKGLLPKDTVLGKEDLKEVFKAVLVLTAQDPVKVMQVNLEDLWLETLPQNVPGTWKERPNWRRRARHGMEELPAVEAMFKDLLERRRA